jgi:hypothetical protein
MPTVDRKDLIVHTILNFQRFRASIVRVIINYVAELKLYPDHIKFLCQVDGDTVDNIYIYSQFLAFIEPDLLYIESNTEQMFRLIVSVTTKVLCVRQIETIMDQQIKVLAEC